MIPEKNPPEQAQTDTTPAPAPQAEPQVGQELSEEELAAAAGGVRPASPGAEY
jgi:hypothetical protein